MRSDFSGSHPLLEIILFAAIRREKEMSRKMEMAKVMAMERDGEMDRGETKDS
jgi:hypothetical protein